jgi:hypothetical protein
VGHEDVENQGLIETAKEWEKESIPSELPRGSWRQTSKNMRCGNRQGTPWLYAELQRVNHENGWRAILQAVDLNKSYANHDGNLDEGA